MLLYVCRATNCANVGTPPAPGIFTSVSKTVPGLNSLPRTHISTYTALITLPVFTCVAFPVAGLSVATANTIGSVAPARTGVRLVWT